MKASVSTVICLLSPLASVAQTYVTPVRGDITPPSPQSAAIVAVQAPEPDLLTGAVSISVPVYTINVDGYELPVSLRYHTNGIKVFDDPAPLGYGWSLMPAMRATRTVLGRPDEHYPSLGDPDSQQDPTAAAYMCMVDASAASFEHTGRYDAEHDIFTFALPGKNINCVLDTRDGKMKFTGACSDEYRVEADARLQAIMVTDPQGVGYVFGGVTECYYENSGLAVATAWALDRIILDTGRVIDFDWELVAHPFASRSWLGGHSFMDNWDLYQWGNSGISQDEFERDSYAEGVLSKCREVTRFLNLKSISFAGGRVDFSYLSTDYGKTMTRIAVNNGTGCIRSYTIGYVGNDHTLISKIDGGPGNVYAFSYNTDYGVNPFGSMDGRHAQDRWGYYNGKPNQSLTPDIRVKTYYSTTNTDGPYKDYLGDADRSVDSVAMQAMILREVTWPTGGKSTFTYGPHHFAPSRLESAGEIHPDDDPVLSYGGGLRVREVTTGNGDGSGATTVRYVYPPATIRSVPSAATFVEVYKVVMPMPDVPGYSSDPVAFMRLVNIMPVSDYNRYDIGATPLWYGKVTALWPEGKVETYFEDVINSKPLAGNISYGCRVPGDMGNVFAGPPVISRQIVYKGSDGTYEAVQTTEFIYERFIDGCVTTNCHIRREPVCVGGDSDPDMQDGRRMMDLPRLSGGSYTVENAYSCHTYNIIPYTCRLTGKTVTEHRDNGTLTESESYTYVPHTRLIASVSSSTSEGKLTLMSVTYADSAGSAIEGAMVRANAVGVPVHKRIRTGEAVYDEHARFVRTSGGAFRQTHALCVYGVGTDTLQSPRCVFNDMGNPVRITDADGVAVDWSWDGMLLSGVSAAGFGTDFLGRTGFALSAVGGRASYGWNAAGLLESDSSRKITDITYNRSGLPERITTAGGDHIDYRYNADGSPCSATVYVKVPDSQSFMKRNERFYCGGFIFEGDSLVMADFPGGYFDGDGNPHYRHPDWQGSVTMTTDSKGALVQHTGYYPYGEPWREPSGQPYLFAGKERLRDLALNDYDFTARRLSSALCLWTSPDPLAQRFADTGPYLYCSANPVKFIDPSGCATFLTYRKNKFEQVGTDGIDDERYFLVTDELSEKIEEDTANNRYYSGMVGNSEEMVELPTFEDLKAVKKLMNNGNSWHVEVGMHKTNDGILVEWDCGGKIDVVNGVLKHNIEPFIVNEKRVLNSIRLKSQWYVHVHSYDPDYITSGEVYPSDNDKKYDSICRGQGFKGATWVIGGRDKKVSFYHRFTIIKTVSLNSLMNFYKQSRESNDK